MSGVYRALAVAQTGLNGEPEWTDNPGALRHQEVINDGSDRWFFSVWSASEVDPTSVRFGLSDEASRLNIRVVPAAWVDALPPLAAEGVLTNEAAAADDLSGEDLTGEETTAADETGVGAAVDDTGETNAPPALTVPFTQRARLYPTPVICVAPARTPFRRREQPRGSALTRSWKKPGTGDAAPATRRSAPRRPSTT